MSTLSEVEVLTRHRKLSHVEQPTTGDHRERHLVLTHNLSEIRANLAV